MSQFLRNTLNFSLDDVELEEETQRILSNGKIKLEEWYINKLIGEINGELDYKDLMPSRKWDFFWKGATFSLIVIMIVFILNTFESIYWKIGLPLIALVVAAIGFLIGLYVKKKKELVTIEKLVKYVFQKLSQWTIQKLHNTNDLNEQRILIENYLNCFFTYRSSLRLPIWDEALHIENIKEIVNNQKYERALKLSFKLFEILYKNKNDQYSKEGVFIIIKIFMQIKYYCDRVAIQKYVEQLEKDFYLQTGVNPTEKPVIQLLPFPQKVEVVNKNYFKFSVPFFQYFDNIWQSGYSDIESGNYIIEDVCENCNNQICVCETDNKTFLYMSQKLKPQILQSSKHESQTIVDEFIKKHSQKIHSEYQDENSQNQSFRKTLMRLEKIGLEINEVEEKQEEILPAVSKLLSIEGEPDSNFKIITDKNNLKIMKKTEEGNPVILVKSYLVVDGSMDDIYTLLTDLELRMQWDSVFSQMKVMKIFNKNCDVVYSYIKAPLFVTDRDFLQKRQLLRNFKDVDYIVAFENYEDPQFPEKKGVIRADSIISGYLIRKKTQEQSYLTIISQNDIKGYIPKAIVNSQVAKAPIGWVKKFNKALKAYKDEKLQLIIILIFFELIFRQQIISQKF